MSFPDFNSDYMEGAHPEILRRLAETNCEKTSGYGTDPYCDMARERIRLACNAPEAQVYFTLGGTATNAAVLGDILLPYQGVISPVTGHIATHEAGAAIRVTPIAMGVGQAAGTASALALLGRTSVQDVDIDKLKASLIEQKAKLE